MRARTSSALALALAAGCSGAPAAFLCNSDKACDANKVCIDHGCAAGAAECPSRYRWDSSTGSRSGRCAVYPDMGVVDELCGNGKLDPGETCDPKDPKAPCPTPADCDDGNPCTNDPIVGEPCKLQCVHTYNNLQDGKKCPVPDGGADAAAGVCYKHLCCAGCWNGASCVGGNATAECGNAGEGCQDCTASSTECTSPSCGANGCEKPAVPDGTPCPTGGGICYGGSCCNGCIQTGGGVTCVPGHDPAACGSGGTHCASCVPPSCGLPDGGTGYRCLGCVPNCGGGGSPKTCGDDGCGGSCGTCKPSEMCVGGACMCVPSPENTNAACSDGIDNDCNGKTDCADASCNLLRCKSTSGMFCSGASCQMGCVIGGRFYSPGALDPTHCQTCDPTRDDSGWSRVTEGTPCSTGGTAGQCHGGACCAGCWDANNLQCRDGDTTTVCGAGGALCQSCIGNNACDVESCNAGACVHAAVPDGQICGPPKGCGGPTDCVSCGATAVAGCLLYGGVCKSGACDLTATGVQCCTSGCCRPVNGLAKCGAACF